MTGGTGGLGSVVTLALAGAGVTCHLTYHREASRRRLEKEEDFPAAQVRWHRVDVTDAGQTGGFYESLDAEQARIDYLLNLVGGFDMGAIGETSAEDWDRMFALNARSVFLHCREAAVRMKRQGFGRIINVSAKAALDTPAGMSAYVAAKAAVLAFTKSLAGELRGDGVTVNAILPSVIDTPANREAMPDAKHDRWVRPEPIADAMLFLLSDAASGVSGAALPLYGRM